MPASQRWRRIEAVLFALLVYARQYFITLVNDCRLCPVGSWTNFADGSNENPCTSAVCDPDMCDDCEIEDTVDNTIRKFCFQISYWFIFQKML